MSLTFYFWSLVIVTVFTNSQVIVSDVSGVCVRRCAESFVFTSVLIL